MSELPADADPVDCERVDVDRLLADLNDGVPNAADRVLELLYKELYELATRHMRGQHRHHTLQATALVNEAMLRLLPRGETPWRNRGHFLAIASQAMRSVLVDHARSKGRLKRGGARGFVSIDTTEIAADPAGVDVLVLHEVLERLAEFDPDMAKASELHLFLGLSLKETAVALSMPMRTFERNWTVVLAWLRTELR